MRHGDRGRAIAVDAETGVNRVTIAVHRAVQHPGGRTAPKRDSGRGQGSAARFSHAQFPDG